MRNLSIPDYSNIFVIGDASYVKNKNGKPLPGLAPVAKQEGNFVAEVIKKNIHNGKPQKNFITKIEVILLPSVELMRLWILDGLL